MTVMSFVQHKRTTKAAQHDSRGGAVTNSEILEYVHDLCLQLQALAQRAGRTEVTELLGRAADAALEAQNEQDN